MQEKAAVLTQFAALAEGAGMACRIKVIANKVEDNDDITYIEQVLRQPVIASTAYDKILREQRRNGGYPSIAHSAKAAMQEIEHDERGSAIDASHHLQKLHELHRAFASQQFPIEKCGGIR